MEYGEQEIENVMRALWDARAQRITPATDEEWARYKTMFKSSMNFLREDAIVELEDWWMDE